MSASEKKKPMHTVKAFETDPRFGKAPYYKIIDSKGKEVARSDSKEVAEQYCKRLNGQ